MISLSRNLPMPKITRSADELLLSNWTLSFSFRLPKELRHRGILSPHVFHFASSVSRANRKIHKYTDTHTHTHARACKFTREFVCTRLNLFVSCDLPCFFPSIICALVFVAHSRRYSLLFPLSQYIIGCFFVDIAIVDYCPITMLVLKDTQSNEERNRMQSISNLYLSLPIACPSFPHYGIGGISIFLYESYRARVSDIRKLMLASRNDDKKKRERVRNGEDARVREQERGRRAFPKKGNEFSRDLYIYV